MPLEKKLSIHVIYNKLCKELSFLMDPDLEDCHCQDIETVPILALLLIPILGGSPLASCSLVCRVTLADTILYYY